MPTARATKAQSAELVVALLDWKSRARLSPREVSALLGVDRATFWRWTAGRQAVSMDAVVRIAELDPSLRAVVAGWTAQTPPRTRVPDAEELLWEYYQRLRREAGLAVSFRTSREPAFTLVESEPTPTGDRWLLVASGSDGSYQFVHAGKLVAEGPINERSWRVWSNLVRTAEKLLAQSS